MGTVETPRWSTSQNCSRKRVASFLSLEGRGLR